MPSRRVDLLESLSDQCFSVDRPLSAISGCRRFAGDD
jgi:hypothetical protein